jgi:hypothetical protein
VSTTRRRGNSEGSNPVQRGDGRWQVHIRHTDEDGRSRRYTVYGSTPKEARAKASAVRERLRANLPARDRKVTLGAFAAAWIDSTLAASDRKASTKAMYATMARQHISGSKIGAQPLDKLRPSHIEAWKVELEHRGLSESTIRSAYTILGAVLDTAVRDGALAQNPAHAVRRPRVRFSWSRTRSCPRPGPAELASEDVPVAELDHLGSLFCRPRNPDGPG